MSKFIIIFLLNFLFCMASYLLGRSISLEWAYWKKHKRKTLKDLSDKELLFLQGKVLEETARRGRETIESFEEFKKR